MKKTLTMFAMALFAAFILSACGNSAPKNAAPADEQQTEAAEDSPHKAILDEYEAILEEMTPIVQKVKEGDQTALPKMQELSQRIQAWGTTNEQALGELTEAEKTRLQTMMQQYSEAMGGQ
ncbi:MAG: hypothetical protein IJ710_04650 [Prevotella sp.]|nr:hypothetical protein [Prevotella sp.]